MLTGTTGTPTGTLSYDPFGAQNGTDSSSVGADAQASLLGYQSQPTDPTTGLVDMGSRLYDPTEGRFTSQDTQFGTSTDPTTLNQYIYAQDSPLVYTDPNGQRPMCNPCSRSETQEVTDEWVAGYAASQGQTSVASYFEGQATYWAAHPSPPPKPAPPPPAAARPIVAQLRGLPTGWSLRHGATSIHGSGDYCVTPPRGAPSCFGQTSIPDESGLSATAGTALHDTLDVVAVPPYAAYYGAYQLGRGVNAVGDRLGPAGSMVSHALVAGTPLPAIEADGLAADAAIDEIKHFTVSPSESYNDEERRGGILPRFIAHGGPQVWLPGWGPGGVDFEY